MRLDFSRSTNSHSEPSSAATYISKHLATILALLVSNTSHHTENSTDVTNKVCKPLLNPDTELMSFAVFHMYTYSTGSAETAPLLTEAALSPIRSAHC